MSALPALLVITDRHQARHPIETIADAVGRISGARTCGCKDALATAIITRPDAVPEQTKKDLAPIVGKYLK